MKSLLLNDKYVILFYFRSTSLYIIFLKTIFVFKILEYKTKFNNSESNIKKLQEVITVQDEQLDGFGEANLILKNKEKNLLEDIKTKQVPILFCLFYYVYVNIESLI